MATKQAKNKIPPDNLALYEKLIATDPSIERKGVTLPYTSFNGHMFTFLSESGSMALRLSAESRAVFLLKYKTSLFEAHGAPMKEYVEVPGNLLENTEELKKYLALSYEYVKTLKPKPRKKAGTARRKK